MTGGRPSTYVPAYADTAKKLCELGATDIEVAEFFDVDVRTVYRWKGLHPEFCQALKAGKDAADDRVERSLYHRALGYSHDAVKIFVHGEKEHVVPYVEHYPPDTTAAIFWLKNRRREQWRDKVDHELTGKDGGPINVKTEGVELARRALYLLAKLATDSAKPETP